MDPPRFDGTIHPHMWIKQVRSFCYLKQIKNEKDILEFCIGMVDVPIKNPEKIKTLDKLVEALKSNISFTVFKNSSQRKLNLLKYNTEREGGNTAKFVAEFRSLSFDAEINDLEEQKKYLFHALPNDYFRNTFINRNMDKTNSLDDLTKMFEDIVQEESNLIRNGSCIAIKHVKTGKYLSSTTKYHQTGSGKQIVFSGQTLPDSNALWIVKASCDPISYNDMISLQHKVTDTLIGRESLTDPHYYNDYMDGDFADHIEVYCSTPSRTLQFNYHWMAQRINYTKYDSSYIRTGDIINIRNVKDNSFLRSHEYQITIYNETFQEVISHDKKLEENDEWCVELIENH